MNSHHGEPDQAGTAVDPPVRTVLIVDDNPQNLLVLGEVLQPTYRVRGANSGERALRAAQSEPRPDIILLDIMMPGVDGYEVLRRLQADPATRGIPVIFITAMTSTEDEHRGLSLGAVDYITKPFAPAIVLARVRTHLELKEARDRLAADNVWLEQEVSRRMKENQLVQDLSLRALACLAEARDSETGHHVLRTQAYVSSLAHRLAGTGRYGEQLTAERIDMIVKAAPLHDIGKVGVPDAILLKPARLTAAEFEIMKTHVVIGAAAIRRAMEQTLLAAADVAASRSSRVFDFLQVAHDIALTHHEKWDGSGYPGGLAGEAIPLAGRLMALADVFDALISERVYKAALPVPETVAIIRDGSGSHFDPAVVDAFLASQEEFAAIASRYAEPAAMA